MTSWLAARHPATQHLLGMLKPNPALPEALALISRWNYEHALSMAERLADGPELTAGLRKLLEAKDCFVRQALADETGELSN